MDNTKRAFITNSQKETMIEFLKKNPDLVSAKFTSTFTFKEARKKWMELTNILNSIPGSKKDWKSWRKTWQDMRSRTKTKKSKNRNHLGGTGGGSFYEDPLTKYEEEILDIIKVVSVEGHQGTKENIVNFDFNTDDNYNVQVEHVEEGGTLKNTDNNDEIITKNVETENLTISENEPKKLINISKKVPKRQTKFLKNSGAAVEMFEKTYKQKVSNKENYMIKKLELLERIAVSKEKSAIAKEKIAESNERNAEASEKMCDVLKDISEMIKEFI